MYSWVNNSSNWYICAWIHVYYLLRLRLLLFFLSFFHWTHALNTKELVKVCQLEGFWGLRNVQRQLSDLVTNQLIKLGEWIIYTQVTPGEQKTQNQTTTVSLVGWPTLFNWKVFLFVWFFFSNVFAYLLGFCCGCSLCVSLFTAFIQKIKFLPKLFSKYGEKEFDKFQEKFFFNLFAYYPPRNKMRTRAARRSAVVSQTNLVNLVEGVQSLMSEPHSTVR